MPIYEYECLDCKKVQEVIQKFSDPPMKVCPDCRGPMRKAISNSSFVLKGTGWYKTDYASSGSADAKGAKASTGDNGCGKGKGSCSECSEAGKGVSDPRLNGAGDSRPGKESTEASSKKETTSSKESTAA